MPANLKEVRIRISSVISTQQITKAMKMVSAAKLRKATDKITQIRPYAQQLQGVMSNIIGTLGEDANIALGTEREVKKVLVVVITSDRGLCGAFNANIIKAAKVLLTEKYADLAAQGNVTVMCIGKKGLDAMKKQTKQINNTFLGLFSDLKFDNVSKAADYIMDGFIQGDFDKVEVVFGEFKNPAVQYTKVDQFLPILKSSTETSTKVDYIYDPSQGEILEELIPKILKTQFFRYLLDNNASEHGARMTAMDKATENAGELLKSLKLSYNRARQAAITTEITEIVSGAAALK